MNTPGTVSCPTSATRPSITAGESTCAGINGIESAWAILKRMHKGTYHQISPKHLDRYVQEFAGRHNVRPQDTADQMAALARGATGKRLRYQDLTAGGPAYPPPEAR